MKISQNKYLGGGGISPLSVGDGGNESTAVYPFPQHEPSKGDRSLALKLKYFYLRFISTIHYVHWSKPIFNQLIILI